LNQLLLCAVFNPILYQQDKRFCCSTTELHPILGWWDGGILTPQLTAYCLLLMLQISLIQNQQVLLATYPGPPNASPELNGSVSFM